MKKTPTLSEQVESLTKRLLQVEKLICSFDGTQNAFIKLVTSDIYDLKATMRNTVKSERVVVFTTRRFFPREFRVPESSFNKTSAHTIIRYEDA